MADPGTRHHGYTRRVAGRPREELIGQRISEMYPVLAGGELIASYRRVMETGVTRYGRDVLAVPAVHKDGTRRSIEFTVALVREDGGSLVGIAAILRDVTKRFEEERRLRARLRVLEERVQDKDEPPRS